VGIEWMRYFSVEKENGGEGGYFLSSPRILQVHDLTSNNVEIVCKSNI